MQMHIRDTYKTFAKFLFYMLDTLLSASQSDESRINWIELFDVMSVSINCIKWVIIYLEITCLHTAYLVQ